jgi:pimeloyl-ACP methyl ester carboxylesterase
MTLPSLAVTTAVHSRTVTLSPRRHRLRVDKRHDALGERRTVQDRARAAQTEAAIAHDASAALGEIDAPTLIIFGARDLVCSTRFAEPLKSGIAGSEVMVCEHLSHAGLHEDPENVQPRDARLLLRQRS